MKRFVNTLVVAASLIAFAGAANAHTKETVITNDAATAPTVSSTTVSNDMGNTTTVNTTSAAPAGGETIVKKKKDSHHLINLGLIKVF